VTNQPNHISVFEHETLKVNHGLTEPQLKALQSFHGDQGVPYFSLIHQGVRFNEFVGVLQVGSLVIEVLPKADKGKDHNYWRSVLLGMLKASGYLNIATPSTSHLKLRQHSILELYFELFATEVQSLIHRGLSKKYRKREGQVNCYKGQVVFAKQVRLNVVHQERVYARYTVFDIDHTIHQILYKALQLVSRISKSPTLHGTLSDLMLRFPEVSDIHVTHQLFDRIHLSRNTHHYKTALEIARLILLNYHPDVRRGHNHVLALMFDMNMLWEKFVYQSLRTKLAKLKPGTVVRPQQRKWFWQPDSGTKVHVVPDIFIEHPNGQTFVIDTKWKNLDNTKPSMEDLRQLFVYHDYFTAQKVSILYPGENGHLRKGSYLAPYQGLDWNKTCALMPMPVDANIQVWQLNLAQTTLAWMEGE